VELATVCTVQLLHMRQITITVSEIDQDMSLVSNHILSFVPNVEARADASNATAVVRSTPTKLVRPAKALGRVISKSDRYGTNEFEGLINRRRIGPQRIGNVVPALTPQQRQDAVSPRRQCLRRVAALAKAQYTTLQSAEQELAQ